MTPRQVLELAEKLFPYDKHMSPEFKGAHALTLTRDGRLCLTIWRNDTATSVYFETVEDEDDESQLREFLESWRS